MVLTSQVQTTELTLQAGSPPSNEYTIPMDDSTTTTVKFEDLLKEASTNNQTSPNVPEAFTGLLHFVQLGYKVPMDHASSFLGYAKDGGYTFDVRRKSRSQKVEWQLPLPNFKQNWTNLMGEDVFIPGHSTVSSSLP